MGRVAVSVGLFLGVERQKPGNILHGHVGDGNRDDVESHFVYELHDYDSLPIQQPGLHKSQQIFSVRGRYKIRVRVHFPQLLGYIEELQLILGEDINIIRLPVELRKVATALDFDILEAMKDFGNGFEQAYFHEPIVVEDTDLISGTERIPQNVLGLDAGGGLVLGDGGVNYVNLRFGQEYKSIPTAGEGNQFLPLVLEDD